MPELPYTRYLIRIRTVISITLLGHIYTREETNAYRTLKHILRASQLFLSASRGRVE